MNLAKWGWVIALVGGLVVGGFLVGIRGRQQAAADQSTLAAYRQTIKNLEAQSAQLDTVYIHQRDTLKFLRTRWDTLTQTILRSDTVRLVSIDTLRLVVGVADSTIRACTNVLGTCEQQKAVLRSIIDTDSIVIRAYSRELARAKIRSRLACTVGPTVTPRGLDYIGASCGIRLW